MKRHENCLSPRCDCMDACAVESAALAEREVCATKAREYAAHYPQGSDGRNTFVLLAEWIENRAKGAN